MTSDDGDYDDDNNTLTPVNMALAVAALSGTMLSMV
jgi:hypothetical protein